MISSPKPPARSALRSSGPGARIATALLGLSLLALSPVSTAAAQVAETWLGYTPIEPFASGVSPRLQAMGNIEVSTYDDQSRIDPYAYGGNPAGFLASRDTSVIETPIGYEDFQDTYFGQSHSAVRRGAGIRGEFRPSERWGILVDLDYGSVSASRHDLCPSPDGCRFIRDFNLPVSPEMAPVTGDRTFGAEVETPSGALGYAREFLGRLTLGARVGYRSESEDRRLNDPYDLDVSSNSTELTGGALYRLPVFRDLASVSAWGQYIDRRILGESESPLNDDEYDWDRPEVAYGGAIHIRHGTWLEGILDGRHRSYDGEEIARVNWAPQFFMNPFPSETEPENVFKRSWSAFLSGLRHNEGSTRWLIGAPGVPVQLGARYAYYRQYEWIRPNEVVIPTVQPLDVRRVGYRFAGGLSLNLPDRAGVAAAEARIAREFREDFTNQVPDFSKITYTYHFGAEYRALGWLPLRAGFEVIHHDPNRQDGIAALKGNGVTAGIGYFWDALDWRIDAAYEHYNFRSAPDDPADEVGFGDRFSLLIQRLF